MPTPSAVKPQFKPPRVQADGARAAADLRFVSDLGRSLLFTVHPRKVACRVAYAIQHGVGAELCAFVAELENIGVVSCAFDSKGEIGSEFLHRGRFEKWIDLLPPQVGYLGVNRAKFLLTGDMHESEYVSPLHINGEIKGAIIVGFSAKDLLTDSHTNLIDAATQMAAMSVNLSAHYEAAINSSVTKAREEHRKFTEAVLDALPVSLYVVDRDYRIVTWNRHREIGLQGIPRDSALGRNVFE